MKTLLPLALATALLLTGCIGWMFHDREMGPGYRGRTVGTQGAPRDPDAPCSYSNQRRPDGRPCSE